MDVSNNLKIYTDSLPLIIPYIYILNFFNGFNLKVHKNTC